MKNFIRCLSGIISIGTAIYYVTFHCTSPLFAVISLFAASVFTVSFAEVEINKNYNINMTDSPSQDAGALGGFHVTKKDLTLVVVAFSIALVASFILGVMYGCDIGKQETTNTQSVIVNNYEKETVKKVNLNTATSSEIMGLTGIGEVKAKEIIANRPYKTIYKLLDSDIIGEDTFNKIKGVITVE